MISKSKSPRHRKRITFHDWFRLVLNKMSYVYTSKETNHKNKYPFVVYDGNLISGSISSDLLVGIKNTSDEYTKVIIKTNSRSTDDTEVCSPRFIELDIPPRSSIAPLDNAYPLPLIYLDFIDIKIHPINHQQSITGIFCRFDCEMKTLLQKTSASFGNKRWEHGDKGNVCFPDVRMWLQNVNRISMRKDGDQRE